MQGSTVKQHWMVRGTLAAGLAAMLASCSNPYDPTQRAVGGALIGAGTGAAIGAVAGGGTGAAIGAGVGGAVGAATGILTTPAVPPPPPPPPPPVYYR
jgi:hypothetical protein